MLRSALASSIVGIILYGIGLLVDVLLFGNDGSYFKFLLSAWSIVGVISFVWLTIRSKNERSDARDPEDE
ncbi:hypothetical protein [Nocardiopsis alba]